MEGIEEKEIPALVKEQERIRKAGCFN